MRVFQSLDHGCIEKLEVRDGEPTFSPAPAVLAEIKLDSEPDPRPECELVDFELRAEITRLFTQMELLGDGSIRRIDIRHGICWRAVIERQLKGVRR